MEEATALSSYAGNGTEIRAVPPHGLQKGMIILCIPISILGLIGTALVTWLLCFKIKYTIYTVYILNIMIANVLNLLYQFMFFLMFFKPKFTGVWFSRIFDVIYAIGYNSSFYVLTTLCVERNLFIFFPVWYPRYRPDYLSIIVCFVFWALSCSLALVEYYVCFKTSDPERSFNCRSSMILGISFDFAIFVPILIFSSLALLIRTLTKEKQNSQARLDITILFTVFAFLLFDISTRIVDLVAFFIETRNIPLITITLLFDCISSSITPCIFFLVGSWKGMIKQPFHTCLETALMAEQDTSETTEANQEEA